MHDATARLAERLSLAPHPEGGFYREVFRSTTVVSRADGARRAAGTAILYLLDRDDVSAWHRVRGADEVWHLYEGGDLALHRLDPGGGAGDVVRLSTDPARGPRVATVPADHWQAARPLGPAAYALCGCTVSPGFEFADFEMADPVRLEALHPQAAEVVRGVPRRGG